jgi:hypothetical protein
VKSTMSANATVMLSNPSAMFFSPSRNRPAIGAGRTLRRSCSFSRALADAGDGSAGLDWR